MMSIHMYTHMWSAFGHVVIVRYCICFIYLLLVLNLEMEAEMISPSKLNPVGMTQWFKLNCTLKD